MQDLTLASLTDRIAEVPDNGRADFDRPSLNRNTETFVDCCSFDGRRCKQTNVNRQVKPAFIGVSFIVR